MKYSILIPTRNGAKYLPYAIKSVLTQKYSDCEVVVSVNHSKDNTYEVLREFSDPRLKIVTPPKPLSMTAHFEWLLKQAKGEWIAVIGDDDALMPYFFEAAGDILQRWPKIKAIASRKGAYYFWEGCEELYGPKVVSFESTLKEKIIHSKWALVSALAGVLSFSDLPQLYTGGLIHSSLIHEIKNKSGGQFYHEMNPDVYSSVALALSTSHYLYIQKPLFWVGSSPKSVGFSFSMNTKGKANEEMKSLSSEFEKSSQSENLSISPRIEESLWRECISSVFVLSALHQVPFPKKLFRGKWTDYLVYASIKKERNKVVLAFFSLFIHCIRATNRLHRLDKKRRVKFATKERKELETIEKASERITAILQESP